MGSDRENHINKLVERGMQQKREQSSRPRPMQTRGEKPRAQASTVTPKRRDDLSSPRSLRSPIEPRPKGGAVANGQSTTRASLDRSTRRPSPAPQKPSLGRASATRASATKVTRVTKQATKPRTQDQPSARSSSSPTSQAYPDRNIWMSLGLLFVAGYLGLCCVSYLVYWDVDQSMSQWGQLFSGIRNSSQVMNWGGRLGSILSQKIIGDGFGLFGLLLPVSLFLLAVQVLRIPTFRIRKGAITALLLMVLGSVVMGHFWGSDTSVLGGGLGGEIGVYASSWLGGMLGFEGTTLLVLVLFAAMVYFSASDSVRLVARKISEYIAKHKELQAAKAQLERIKREEALHMAALRSEQAKSALIEKQEEEANKLRSRLGSTSLGDRYDHVDTSSLTYTDLPTSHTDQQIANNHQTDSPSLDQLEQDFEALKAGDEFTCKPIEASAPDITTQQSTTTTDPTTQSPSSNNDSYTVASHAQTPPPARGYLAGYDAQGNEIIYYWLGGDYAVNSADPSHPTEPLADDQPTDIEFTTFEIDRTLDLDPEPPIEATIQLDKQPVAYVQDDPSFKITQPIYSDNQFDPDDNSSQGQTQQGDDPYLSDNPQQEYFQGTDGELVTRFSPSKEDPNFIVEQKISEQEVDDDTINLTELYDPTLELASYVKPPIELMDNHMRNVNVTQEELVENKNRIVTTLENFGIKIDTIEATIGPTVTLYEIIPAPGVRISKIKNLEDDIALSLSALGIRIIAPIPGKGTIGIEVPNKDKEVVSMYSVIKSAKFQDSKAELPIALGKTIQNETFVLDLAKMPHLLVAGATGQGKSVGLNAIITSLLYKKHPSELKFVLVDPKKVELTLYARLEKHFLAKLPDAPEAIITDTQKVIYTLNSLCIEMDSRYDLLKAAKVRNISEYNDKFINRRLNPNKGHRFLPYFVVVVDEFADLIMTAGREIETPIARIAQLARAVGIHLIIATQRPTTNIITGVIKANFPARIAFRVSSMIDSRTILDSPGANQLVGKGDMLVSTGSEVTRVQCAFIDTPEVDRIAEHIGSQRGYPTAYELPEYVPEGEASSSLSSEDMGKRDSLFEEVARYVVANDNGSASTIQRKFSIGFNRAGRIVDQLEAAGILGRPEGSKPRQVLIQDPMSLEMLLDNM